MTLLQTINSIILTVTGQATVNPWLTAFFCISAALGFIQLFKISGFVLNFLYRYLIRRPLDHMATYGSKQKDSWVVITGGSDGIGLCYAKEQAKKGFNICIIARNEKKILERLEEIKKESGKNIKTKCVVADFASITTYAPYAKVAEQLSDIDIAMLFLNAGYTQRGPYKDLYPHEIETIVNVNLIHVVYLMTALTP